MDKDPTAKSKLYIGETLGSNNDIVDITELDDFSDISSGNEIVDITELDDFSSDDSNSDTIDIGPNDKQPQSTQCTRIKFFDQIEDIIFEVDSEDLEDLENPPKLPIEPEDINSTTELLEFIEFIKKHKLYRRNKAYLNLVKGESSVRKIDTLVGMDQVKKSVVTQILGMAKPNINKGNINCAVYGDPGCGKTTLAHILGDIYKTFGIVKSGHFTIGDRVNMIGTHIGETEQKTKKILEKAVGGILFLDEVYQFGCHQDGNRDIFAKTCIDAITQFITQEQNIGKLIIIVAGYKDEVQKNFFAQNKGLDRRFPWQYTINNYDSEELQLIFLEQAKQHKYEVADGAVSAQLFLDDEKLFKHGGGDTESLLTKCIMIHEKRTIAHPEDHGTLSKVDIDKGFKLHKEHRENNEDTEDVPDHVIHMYS